MEWLKAHWVILAALVAVSTAWGQQQQKITTIEQALILQKSSADKIEELKMQVVRQDEQLKTIKESQLKMEVSFNRLVELKEREMRKTK